MSDMPNDTNGLDQSDDPDRQGREDILLNSSKFGRVDFDRKLVKSTPVEIWLNVTKLALT